MENLKSNASYMRTKFYTAVETSRRIDNSFAHPDDKDLTRDEIRQINEYWGKYKFAYPDIDYKSFKTFKNRLGRFDVRHCPGSIRMKYFFDRWVSPDYRTALQNKGLLPLLFHDVKQPRTVLRRMNGIFTDEDYEILSYEKGIKLLLKESLTKRLILKSSNLGGGQGIYVLDHTTGRKTLEAILSNLGSATFVVQEYIEQSSFMKQFNETSVNTLRITSLLWKEEVIVLAALIRIGRPGSLIDNYSQGGSIIGLNLDTGVCNNWALTHENERVTVLPSGLDLRAKKYKVPNFKKVIALIKKMHSRLPYIAMVSWDIALGKNNEPIFIEDNFAGMIQIHEAVTGPIFGDLMDELLDTYLLNNFSIDFKAGDFTCAEYHDHVEIRDYLGSDRSITIPETLERKPVTRISRDAFTKRKIDEVTVSEQVAKNSSTALARVPSVIIR